MLHLTYVQIRLIQFQKHLFLSNYFNGNKSDWLCCACSHCKYLKLSEMNHTPALFSHLDVFDFCKTYTFSYWAEWTWKNAYWFASVYGIFLVPSILPQVWILLQYCHWHLALLFWHNAVALLQTSLGDDLFCILPAYVSEMLTLNFYVQVFVSCNYFYVVLSEILHICNY